MSDIPKPQPSIKAQLRVMMDLEQGENFIWPSKQRFSLWYKLMEFMLRVERYVDRTQGLENRAKKAEATIERVRNLDCVSKMVEGRDGEFVRTVTFIADELDKALEQDNAND